MDERIRFAFTAGWYAGAIFGEQTARQAAADHPEYSAAEIDAYGQGSIDGAAGDTWRRDFPAPAEG